MSTTARTAAPFIWYELATTDPEAAFAFYSHVLGWNRQDMKSEFGTYLLVGAGPGNAGGIMSMPPAMREGGARPFWTMYLGVDDAEASVARIKAAGGKVLAEPMDIPGIGRFAAVTDPHGAAFYVMKPFSTEGPPAIPDGSPGHVGWRELHAGNGDEAWKFYSSQFGWRETQAMDMGPAGTYHLFATGEQAIGGMMTKMEHTPVPHWMFYFYVDALDAALERLLAKGGTNHMGPHQVPGGQWIAVVSDPQGAVFGLLSQKR